VKLIPITPTKDLFALAAVARAIRTAHRNTAEDAQQDLAKTVAGWDRQVQFAITTIPDGFLVTTDDEIWGFVDQGTKPHLIPAIVPVNKKAITILGPGRPKTAPRVIGSGSGAKGPIVAIRKRTKPIQHPGTEARAFSETLQDKYNDELPRRIDAALAGVL